MNYLSQHIKTLSKSWRRRAAAALSALVLSLPLANAAWDTWAQPPYQDLNSDDAFYDDITHRAWLYFIDRTNASNGLTQDRSSVNGSSNSNASVAASGWYLTALVIGAERGWMSWSESNTRAINALRFFSGANSPSMPHTHGFFRHFVDKSNGSSGSEVSTIDTAILVSGALIAGNYFGGDALTQANSINGRVEWNWMRTRNGNVTSNILPQGYDHPTGSLNDKWNFISATYGWSEAVTCYLLGLGTPDSGNKLPNASWNSLEASYFPTYYVDNYGTLECFENEPIFIPQQPQNFFPFENRTDKLGQNYWNNAVNSTLIHRQFVINHRPGGPSSPHYDTYWYHAWGLNACDHPGSTYAVDRAPWEGSHSGVICPVGAVAAAPFCKGLTDDFAARAGRYMYDNYRSNIWGRYGFRDAYKLDSGGNWWGPDAVGINLGMMMCNVENARSGLLWRVMGMAPTLYRAYTEAEMHPVMTTGATYVLEPSHALGKVLRVIGTSSADGTDVEQRTPTGALSEQWILKPSNSGYWKLTNVNSNKVMEVTGGSTSNGAIVQQGTYSSSNNYQQWEFIPAGSYSYGLKNRNSGKFLDVNGVAEGAIVQQWNNTTPPANEIFKFYEVPTVPMNLTATAGATGTRKITVGWDKRYNATGYDVWRSTSQTGTFTKIASNITATTYLDTAPTQGTTYWYTTSGNNGPAFGPAPTPIPKTAP